MHRKNKESRQRSTECVHDACVREKERDHERERMRENKSTDCVQEEHGE